jgi:hypothetical protein
MILGGQVIKTVEQDAKTSINILLTFVISAISFLANIVASVKFSKMFLKYNEMYTITTDFFNYCLENSSIVDKGIPMKLAKYQDIIKFDRFDYIKDMVESDFSISINSIDIMISSTDTFYNTPIFIIQNDKLGYYMVNNTKRAFGRITPNEQSNIRTI